MKKMKDSTKKNIIRVIMFIAALAMISSFVILPLVSGAEENTSVSVESFESGKLSEALYEAMNGVDRNNIRSAAVSGGELTAADFSALCELPNLEYIELAGALAENGEIPDNALPARNQLTYISLPANTVSIGNSAFSNCKVLKKISMPAAVESIGDYAFDGCISLGDITVPVGLTSIGEAAFRDCQSLSAFTLPQGVTRIPAYCFSKCPFTEFYVGPQVESIGEGAFSDCHELKDIYIYGDSAPELEGGGVFQNLNVTVHMSDDAEGFDGWNNNFVSTAEGFNDEYVPPETAAPADDIYDETSAADESPTDEKTEESADESTAADNADGDKAAEDTDDDASEKKSSAETEAVTSSDSSVNQSADANTGSSPAVTIVIAVIAAAAVTVIVNLIFIKARKK